MEHPTSIWAAWYGIPDPAPTAASLLNMLPAELAVRTGASGETAGRIGHATGAAADALAWIGSGWNNPAPRSAVATLIAAARHGAQVLATAAAAGERTAATLESVMAAVKAGYTRADAIIAGEGLLRMDPPLGWPLDDIPVGQALRAARVGVVVDLGATVTASHLAATTALSELNAALADDPRALLASVPGCAGAVAASTQNPSSPVDSANRAALSVDLDGSDPIRARFAARILDALRHAATSAGPGTVVQLLSYDPRSPAGQGGAAIAIGDVSAADDVAVVVPGVGNSPGAMTGAIDAATTLRSNSIAADPDASVAAVAWLGYDLPLSFGHDVPVTPLGVLDDSLIALDDADAIDGGRRLSGFTAQLRAEMTPSARLTLVGHSYGSVVVSQAATVATGVDDVVLLAAPGSGPDARDASAYTVSPDHVFALSFEHDPITAPVIDLLAAVLVPATARPPGPPFGEDPVDADFGAQVIDVPTNVPAISLGTAAALPGGPAQALLVDTVTGLGQHPLTNYLAGAAGLAVGAIVVGKYTGVRTRKGR